MQTREKFHQSQAMHCTGLVFLLSSSLLWLLSQGIAQPNYTYSSCSGANYTANSTYQTNINSLLSNLSSAISSTGFQKATIGQNPNTVNGLFLCRGDITSEECQNCVTIAGGNIKQFCPNETAAIIWYDLCMLRYSNQFIFSIMQEAPAFYLQNANNVSNSDQFKPTLQDFMDGLVRQAAYGSSTRMYAAGASNFSSSFGKIYGLVQCTPDISQDDCFTCLVQGEGIIPTYGINDKQGARIGMPSCNLRFELYSFSESNVAPPAPSPPGVAAPPAPSPPGVAAPPAPSPPATPGNGRNSSTIVIITVVLGITAVILVSVLCICFCIWRKPKSETDGVDDISVVQSLQFDFETIRAATDNFSDLNKLGQGGFGAVYKGKLSNGQEVAVKRLSRDSGQGEVEFKNEMVLVAKLQHRNLVGILGFSLQREEKLLIYEFLPNTSLDHFIFDPIKRTHLDWEKRHKIIRGIARGLLYLHEDSRLRIIHRDLKASNVLLDGEMNPKISDFGMARLFEVDQTQNTNRIVGTYGYMAPEYALHGFYSVKSDVFSFGVLLLEILSGQKNNNFYQLDSSEDLRSYAWRNWREDTPLELIDTTLRGNCLISEVKRCIHIGLLCVQENVADRPTMASVDLMFNSSSHTLPIPSSPAFSVYNGSETDRSSSSKNDSKDRKAGPSTTKPTPISINGTSITELYPR